MKHSEMLCDPISIQISFLITHKIDSTVNLTCFDYNSYYHLENVKVSHFLLQIQNDALTIILSCDNSTVLNYSFLFPAFFGFTSMTREKMNSQIDSNFVGDAFQWRLLMEKNFFGVFISKYSSGNSNKIN